MSQADPKQADSIDVAYVANLARLQLEAAEAAAFQKQLEQVIEHFQELTDLDLDGVEPTAHGFAVQNVFRADEVQPSLDRAVALSNAPAHVDDQFTVPKIVE